MPKVVLLIILLICSNSVFARDLEVEIAPKTSITTSNNLVREGDLLEFVTLNEVVYKDSVILPKNATVSGLVTARSENGWHGQFASLYIEQFVVETPRKNLKGVIFQKGNPHAVLFESVCPLLLGYLVRGGEVVMTPKNTYTLFLEVK